MPTTTTNLNLTKPLPTERYDVEVFNANAEAIDAAVTAAVDHAHDGTAGQGPPLAAGALAEGAVTAAALADGAVTTAGIADGAVTAAKIAEGIAGGLALTNVQNAAAQNDASVANYRAEAGFGYITGTGSGTRKGKPMTFGAAFASAPIVFITTLGFTDRSITSPASFHGTTDDLRDWRAITISVSGFTAEAHTDVRIEANRHAGFAWLAIGEVG